MRVFLASLAERLGERAEVFYEGDGGDCAARGVERAVDVLAHLVDGVESRRPGFVASMLAGEAKGGERGSVGEALHDGVHEAGVAEVGEAGANLTYGGPVHANGVAGVEGVRDGDAATGARVAVVVGGG